MTIRVLLIDDHTFFRFGVHALLTRQPDFEVVGEAADGIEGIARAKELRPEVILLDLNMPGVSGLETLKLLKRDWPQIAVVMLTVSDDLEQFKVALREGARGFLRKNIETDMLASSIRRAAAGQLVIDEDMAAKLVASMRLPDGARGDASLPDTSAVAMAAEPLTACERDVMRELTRGASDTDIARTLSLAESADEICVRDLLRTLSITSRVQMAPCAAGYEDDVRDTHADTSVHSRSPSMAALGAY